MDEIGCDCSFQKLLVLETIQNKRDICLEMRERLCKIQLYLFVIVQRIFVFVSRILMVRRILYSTQVLLINDLDIKKETLSTT